MEKPRKQIQGLVHICDGILRYTGERGWPHYDVLGNVSRVYCKHDTSASDIDVVTT